ncbi:MAG: CPBP family intramembrane metalloprotease [Clostridia bacterium]|nr:CPBP family intramembrane metalloprotease [Clostridia bacterium]
MKRLYEKSQLTFSIVWIVAYCVLMSVGDSLSAEVGINSIISLPVAFIMSGILLLFIKKYGLSKKYGLCKPEVSAKEMLYYIPLALLLLANVMFGVKLNVTVGEAVIYMLTMLCVGLLEEIIFRGMLFKAMAENGLRSAIAVSSITFGIGHIINLFNGSGAELLPNLLQVVYAVAAGFMFVMIFLKSGSLIPCIILHGVFNALSVFADETALTVRGQIISCIFLVAVSGFYGGYLALRMKKKSKKE